MSGTLGFPVSPDLHNSFDTLLIFFHGLLNECQRSIFQLSFSQNVNSKEFRGYLKISTNMMLSSPF